MEKPDDSTLTREQYALVRSEAERALQQSGALGVFPTPIEQVMASADVEEVHEDVLNESFIAKMRKQGGDSLKKALSKVIGLFDAKARLIFIDRSIAIVKQKFVRLHEIGHAFLTWQRDLYGIVEDCEKTIEPELADQFDREANVFASEVLFQLDHFQQEAAQYDFSILTPVRLSRSYGSSIYSAVRQYVTKHHRSCAVLVLNPPQACDGFGFTATLRRRCFSRTFLETFGNLSLPPFFTPDDQIGRLVPINGRKMTGQRQIDLKDLNGDEQVCIAEAFTQTHQIFVLIHATNTLKPLKIII